MSDKVYRKLAKVLDALPSGFPSSEIGLEIKVLKKVFEPEEADLFCDLRLSFETAQQIAERTGRPVEGLEGKLTDMLKKGQIFGIDFGTVKVFRMVPWILGIWEFQLHRMDKELAELCAEYNALFFPQFFRNKPQLMQVIPVQKEIPNIQQALSYEQVSTIIENGKSFAVDDCICKKEQRLLGHDCKKPLEVCMRIAPVAGVFEKGEMGRPISKEEAYDVLRKSEEAALVHLTHNLEAGQFFICNCCGCCCGPLKAINRLGIRDAINSHYYAEIDPDRCVACGTCANERCQVSAIEEGEGAYRVIKDRCIGCGLCVNTCPSEAIQLVHKRPEEIVLPPRDEMEWYERRGQGRGVDFSAYK